MTPEELLAEFTRQVRLTDADTTPGNTIEWDGPVRRDYPADPAQPWAIIECPCGIPGTEAVVDEIIARQRAFFTGRGQSVEWKTYATDPPADLPQRLARHGFRPGDVEVVMLGEARGLIGDLDLPEGLRLRQIHGVTDWRRVCDLMAVVWGSETAQSYDGHRLEQEADPEGFIPCVVEDGGTGAVVSYASLRLTPGVDFAGLWGGSTHPAYRGRGLYRALTGHRARLALARGHRLVRVDTSPDSRPILTRLGLHAVTTTTPCLLDAGEP